MSVSWGFSPLCFQIDFSIGSDQRVSHVFLLRSAGKGSKLGAPGRAAALAQDEGHGAAALRELQLAAQRGRGSFHAH